MYAAAHQYSVGSKIYTCSTAMKLTSERNFFARAIVCTHTHLVSCHSFVVCCSSLISSCPCDRLIGFDVVNFIIIFLIASIHFTNFIIKTQKFVASKARAKQKQNKTPSTDMTWKEKVTLKVLISFQSNLRSKRANIFIWQWMSIFSKRDIWPFCFFLYRFTFSYTVDYILPDFDRTDSTFNK